MADEQKPAEGKQSPNVITTTLNGAPLTLRDPEAEIAAAVAAAKADWQRDADEKAKQAQAEAERKDAEKRGEWEKIAADERAKREAMEQQHAAEKYQLQAGAELRDYLAEKHPALVNSAKYILPLIPSGLTDKGRAEAIAKQADDFAKSIPAAPKSAAAPAPRPSGQRVASDRPALNDPTRRRFSSLNYRG